MDIKKSLLRIVAISAAALIAACGDGCGQAKESEPSARAAQDVGTDTAAIAPIDTLRFTDNRDGREYRTVNIGKYTWMAENLNFEADTGADGEVSGSWCYDDADSNCAKYGKLYTWRAALDVCPSGWHLPSSAEWNNLVYAAGQKVAGKRLKSKAGWAKNGGTSGNGTDTFGFSALPGGYRSHIGGVAYYKFHSAEWYAYFWSADERGEYDAYRRGIVNVSYDDAVFGGFADKKSGFSVRCVKDRD